MFPAALFRAVGKATQTSAAGNMPENLSPERGRLARPARCYGASPALGTGSCFRSPANAVAGLLSVARLMPAYVSQPSPKTRTQSSTASQISWCAGMRSAITVSTFQKPVGAVMVGILGRVREGLFMGLLAVYISACGSFFAAFHPLVFRALKTARD